MLGDLVALSACVAALCVTVPEDPASPTWDTEQAGPGRQALIWNQSPRKQRKLRSCQPAGLLENSQRGTPTRTPGALLRGDQSPGAMGDKRPLTKTKLWGYGETGSCWCWEKAGPQETEAINAEAIKWHRGNPLLCLLPRKTCLQGGCFVLSAHKNYSK